MAESFFKNKLAVVTGAASGIGEALARALAAEGAHLALCDVNLGALERLQAELTGAGCRCHIRLVDVADVAAISDFAAEVATSIGPVDLVFNNAGVAVISSVEAIALADAHWLMNINFWGVVNGCRAFLPALRAQGKGYLVNISSIFAMVSMPTQAFYNASKAAVRGFSDALREEVRDAGISVLCVHPGGVKTRIAEDARIPDPATIGIDPTQLRQDFLANARTTPQEAARQILLAVRTGQTRLILGADARILELLSRIFPARVSYWFSALARRHRDKQRR